MVALTQWSTEDPPKNVNTCNFLRLLPRITSCTFASGVQVLIMKIYAYLGNSKLNSCLSGYLLKKLGSVGRLEKENESMNIIKWA